MNIKILIDSINSLVFGEFTTVIKQFHLINDLLEIDFHIICNNALKNIGYDKLNECKIKTLNIITKNAHNCNLSGYSVGNKYDSQMLPFDILAIKDGFFPFEIKLFKSEISFVCKYENKICYEIFNCHISSVQFIADLLKAIIILKYNNLIKNFYIIHFFNFGINSGFNHINFFKNLKKCKDSYVTIKESEKNEKYPLWGAVNFKSQTKVSENEFDVTTGCLYNNLYSIPAVSMSINDLSLFSFKIELFENIVNLDGATFIKYNLYKIQKFGF